MPRKSERRSVAYDPDTEPTAEELAELPIGRLPIQNAPGRRMISLRLREPLLEGLKQVARSKQVPYQVLIQMWLQERLDLELQGPPETHDRMARLVQLTRDLHETVLGLQAAPAASRGRSTRKGSA